ncbi:MAG TPA: zinc ribbon domain-containing protein [Gemmataceae bacterium]|nr:zinc ribbon domain-containing protein [Gemmataceae bacterium]
MSATVLCSGCGGRVAIPDDNTRARIRCPECGVMNDVPASAQKPGAGTDRPRRAAAPAADDAAAEQLLLGEDAPPPAAKEKPARRKSAAAIQAVPPRPPETLHPLPPSPNEQASDDEEDGRPYRVPGLDDVRPCPVCRYELPRDAVLCNRCGYNLQTGKKAKQSYDPFERDWRGGWPVNVRRGIFIGGEVFFLTACLISVLAGAPVFGVFFPWVVFTAMTAFLLGTYDHIRLTRNKKGRVRMTKTWTVCFIPRPPQEIDVLDYGGVAHGPRDETSVMEWMILLTLLLAGIIPGLLWLYFVFVRTSFEVSMTKQHGHDELVVYRGSNEKMVVDIAETLRKVARLSPV